MPTKDEDRQPLTTPVTMDRRTGGCGRTWGRSAVSPMSEVVLTERSGGMATITLNRPERLNAMNAEVVAGPVEAVVPRDELDANTPEQPELEKVATEQELTAALAWRDARCRP